VIENCPFHFAAGASGEGKGRKLDFQALDSVAIDCCCQCVMRSLESGVRKGRGEAKAGRRSLPTLTKTTKGDRKFMDGVPREKEVQLRELDAKDPEVVREDHGRTQNS